MNLLEAELTSLIFSVSSLDSLEKETEFLVYTNFQCIQEFIDCHVYQWEMAGWEMENGQKPPQVVLCKKLSDLFFYLDVDLIEGEETDDKIQRISIKLKQ